MRLMCSDFEALLNACALQARAAACAEVEQRREACTKAVTAVADLSTTLQKEGSARKKLQSRALQGQLAAAEAEVTRLSRGAHKAASALTVRSRNPRPHALTARGSARSAALH